MNFYKRIKKALKVLTSEEKDREIRKSIEEPMTSSDNLNERFMIDFRADRFSLSVGSTTISSNDASDNNSINLKKTMKIAVSPKDVVDELKKSPTNMSIEGIDSKISILEMKKSLIEQRYSMEYMTFLIIALKNRKKYDNECKVVNITFREFFSRFDITDEIKIAALLNKYDLVMKSADLFIPEFPNDAIEVMHTYRSVVKELTDKDPRFYVIATTKDFRDADGKRDPILIAQSPFGMYYYILGAWDKEMLYLPEL